MKHIIAFLHSVGLLHQPRVTLPQLKTGCPSVFVGFQDLVGRSPDHFRALHSGSEGVLNLDLAALNRTAFTEDSFAPNFCVNVLLLSQPGMTQRDYEDVKRTLSALDSVVQSLSVFGPWKSLHVGPLADFSLHFPTFLIQNLQNSTRIVKIREDLRGKTLDLSYYAIWPFVLKSGKFRGSDVTVLEYLEDKFGFRVAKPKRSFVLDYAVLPNGTSSGIVADVSEGRSDFAVVQAGLSLGRFRRVDFGPMMDLHEIGFMGGHVKPVDNIYTMFLTFDLASWLAFAATVACTAATLMVIDVAVRGYRARDVAFANLSIALVAPIQESLPPKWFRDTSRLDARLVLIGTWLVMGHVVAMAYKSNLLASLAIVGYEKPINTMEDVYASKLPVVTLEDTLFTTFLEKSPRKVHNRIYQELSKATGWEISYKSRIRRAKEIDELARDGKLLVAIAKRAMSTKRFARFTKETFINTHTSWVFPKHSRLRDLFGGYIARLRDNGVMEKLKRDFRLRSEIPTVMNRENHKYLEGGNAKGNTGITVRQIQAALALVGIGFLLSVIAFAVESSVGFYRNHFRRLRETRWKM